VRILVEYKEGFRPFKGGFSRPLGDAASRIIPSFWSRHVGTG
jgi:hypothetical protein